MSDSDIHSTRPVTGGFDQRTLVIRALVIAALVLLGTGAVSPLLTTERFYFFSNTFSLASGLRQLVANNQVLIAFIIGLFSLCVPIVKAIVIWLATGQSAERGPLLAIADRFGKWSMLEVFVAAMLLISLKLGPVVDATLHYGAWLLAASVLASGIASQLLVREPHAGPLFSSPVTLTVGGVGGAVAATLMIGLLNPDVFRIERLVGTPESRCISRAFRLDRLYATSSAAEPEYASSLQTIPLQNCPEAFSDAFGEYADAWTRLESFTAGAEEEPSLLERAGARLGLIATRDTTLEDIEDAWAELERIALEFDVTAPAK